MNAQQNLPLELAGRRVLVAEDDPFIAAEMEALLAGIGVEVVGPVPTVRAAMGAIEAVRPDAAVLDVNLRDACSTPIADALRAASVPVVLVTGCGRHLLDDPGLRDADVLSKPVRSHVLVGLLHRLLARRRQGQRV